MSKMLRFTEAEFHARIHAYVSGSKCLVLAPIKAPVLHRPDAGEEPDGTAGSDSAGEGWIVVPYPVSVNRAYRNFRGRMVMSAEGREFKRMVASSWALAGQPLIEGPVSVHYRLHPKLTKDGRASKTRQDVANMEKLLSDALNGLAWTDDKQIECLLIELSYPVKGGAVSVRVKSAL